ncbi:hypothetical protein ACP4OV_002370 [Aristida adscensionis]
MAAQDHAAGAGDTEAPLLPLPATTRDPPPPRRNTFAFVSATLASMTTILLGYNFSLMSGAQLFIREDLGLSDEQVEVLTGSMNLFMLASILAAGWVADALGRRGALVLANAFLMAGALAMSLGGSYAALMSARFVTSVGAGLARVVAPVYNAEISPASTRGVLSSLLDMFINVGLLLSYVSNYAFAGLPVHLSWRAMFAVGAIPPVFLAAAVHAMSESPRWLAMRGRYGDARAVLVRTSDTPAEVDLRLEEIKRAHASGVEAIELYSPLVLKKAGAVKTGLILVATVLSDRVGRRPLLLASMAGVAVAQTSLALVLLCAGKASALAAPACLAAVLAFVAAFSVGLGPVVATYSTEVVPLRLRAQGASLAVTANKQTCSAVSMTFISLADAITMPGCFFLYAGVVVAGCAFVYARLPETRGRSLEDMDELFAK